MIEAHAPMPAVPRIGALLVVIALATAVPARARADDAAAAPRDVATQRYNEALDLEEAGDSRGALAKLREAHAIFPTPIIDLALARASAREGDLVGGRALAAGVALLPRKGAESARTIAARAEAAALEAQLLSRIPTVRLAVRAPVAASATIDERAVPLDAGPIPLNPGSHAVVVLAGAARRELTVSLREGDRIDLPVVLGPPLAPSDPAGDLVAPRPAVASAPREEPGPPRRGASAWAVGGFGVAAAGVVAGSIAGALAFGKASGVNDACPQAPACPAAAREDYDASRRLGTLATVSFVLAGAGLATGVLALVLTPRDGSTRSVRVTVGLGQIAAAGAF